MVVMYILYTKPHKKTLILAFVYALVDYIKNEMGFFELPTSMDRLIESTTRIDLCIHLRRQKCG